MTISGFSGNSTITVEIDNGKTGDAKRTASIEITTDAEGNGSGTWSIPDSGWNGANFNAGSAQQFTIAIS